MRGLPAGPCLGPCPPPPLIYRQGTRLKEMAL